MNENVNISVRALVDYALSVGLSDPLDRVYLTNAVLSMIGETEYAEPETAPEARPLPEILSDL